MKHVINIYTDGSADRDGYGGWAFWIPFFGTMHSGLSTRTTNNRMEMYAALRGLRWARNHRLDRVRIISDSNYVVKAFREGWLESWQAKGWLYRPPGSPAGTRAERPNRDLWERLLRLASVIEVEWEHVHGHIGVEGNERCDEAAGAERLRARKLAGV